MGLLGMVRVGDVAHMQDEIRIRDFFQSCTKGSDKFGRQIGNEPDGVGHDDVPAVRQAHLPHGGIQGGEQHVLCHDPCPGQKIEKCRLPGIGVADECDKRKRNRVSRLSLQLAGSPHFLNALLEQSDAVAEQAPVRFDAEGRGSYDEAAGLRTSDAVSAAIEAEQVAASILMFGAVYLLLFLVWLRVMNDKIQKGPDLPSPPADSDPRAILDVAAAHGADRAEA